MIKVTLKNGKELKKDTVSAGEVRKIMKFGRKIEAGEVDNLEIAETFVSFFVGFFPEEKDLEKYLWDEYTMPELMELCENALMQSQGGQVTEEAPSEA